MKTIDGMPQYDSCTSSWSFDNAGEINEDLREWFAARKCSNCCHCIVSTIRHMTKTSWDGSYKCNILGFEFGNIEPKIFSCQAFEPGYTYPITETIEPIPVLGVLGEETHEEPTK